MNIHLHFHLCTIPDVFKQTKNRLFMGPVGTRVKRPFLTSNTTHFKAVSFSFFRFGGVIGGGRGLYAPNHRQPPLKIFFKIFLSIFLFFSIHFHQFFVVFLFQSIVLVYVYNYI